MSRQVAVMSLDADDGKIILVVVCTEQGAAPECYTNKNQKHAGRVVAGQFVAGEKDEPLTEHEAAMVVRTCFALRGALGNIHG